jgi:hypothetical protein
MKKRSKLEKLTPFFLGTCMLTLVAACGNDDDSDNNPAQQQQEQQQEGEYQVTLTPVNANVAGDATGTGTFSLSGDDFTANLSVSGLPYGTHAQHIHVGTACAGAGADTNGDGYIDAMESTAVSGDALIPLDRDLRAQIAGSGYPSGSTYTYNESASFLTMLADLQLPDTDTGDEVVKLPVGSNLNLEGRVVAIHGIPASTTLPPTVQGMGDMSPQQALPILCGVITRSGGTTTGTTGTTTGTTGTGITGR